MGDNDNIILRDLGAKLAMLIALSAAKRSSDLTLLDTSLMADLGDKVVFHIKGLSKTRKVGQKPASVEIFKFEEDVSLDPIACLNEYLARTKNLRPPREINYSSLQTTPTNQLRRVRLRVGYDISWERQE